MFVKVFPFKDTDMLSFLLEIQVISLAITKCFEYVNSGQHDGINVITRVCSRDILHVYSPKVGSNFFT